MANPIEVSPPKLVVDTSIALKWFFLEEEDADNAGEILDAFLAGDVTLLVPSTFFPEAANALIRGQYKLTVFTLDESYDNLSSMDLSVSHAGHRVVKHAMQLALDHGITVYDALFLALAQREQCDFVTADRRAWTRLHNLTQVHFLSHYQVP